MLLNEGKNSFSVVRFHLRPALQVTRVFNNLDHNAMQRRNISSPTFVVAFTLLKVSKMQTGWW